MGKYYFPTKQKRHNLIYKGRLTKYQRAKQNKEILIMMAFAIPFILTQAFLGATNDIKIDASLASENGAGVSAIESNEVGDVADTQANTSPTKLPPYEETLPFVWKENKAKIMEISYYSELDSCHYPTDEGCLTASGKIAEVGMVATNLFPFGTKIKIDGVEYTVEDRISEKFAHRIDIFTGYGKRAYIKAIKEGVKKLPVVVIDN